MTAQITEEAAQATTPTFADRKPVAEALLELTEMFGHLPIPSITMYTVGTPMNLQLRTADAFEQWRTALQIAPSAVSLHGYNENAWLSADTAFRGVRLELSGYGLPLTAEQAETPQVVDEVPSAVAA